MDPTKTYIEGFIALLRTQHVGNVREVIDARLSGTEGAVHGLVSPPLSEDEMDPTDLLALIERKLRREDSDSASVLRRAVVETINGELRFALPNEERLILLGDLCGAMGLRDDQEVSDNLGHILANRLMATINGCDSHLLFFKNWQQSLPTRLVIGFMLDQFTALIRRPNEGEGFTCNVEKGITPKIMEATKNDLGAIKYLENEEDFQLMMVLFGYVMKAAPEETARDLLQRFLEIVVATAGKSDRESWLQGWYSLLAEHAEVIPKGGDWAEAFTKGLEVKATDYARAVLGDPIWAGSFERLGHLGRTIRMAAQRLEQNPHKVVEIRDGVRQDAGLFQKSQVSPSQKHQAG